MNHFGNTKSETFTVANGFTLIEYAELVRLARIADLLGEELRV